MPSPTTLGGVGMAAVGSFPVGGSADPLTPGVFLVVGGVNLIVTERFQDSSLEMQENVGGIKTLDFLHKVVAGGVHLEVGERVILRQETVNIFLGTLDRIDEEKVPGNEALFTRAEAVDLGSILDRRLVTIDEAFTNQLSGNIVRSLMNTYVSGEGLTLNSVLDGSTVATFSVGAFKTVAKALRDLSDRTGFIFFVDANGDLHWESQTQVLAPFAIADIEDAVAIPKALKAPDGGLWRVDVTDDGVLQTVSVPSGFLGETKLGAPDGTTWALGVTNAGVLTTTSSSGPAIAGWALRSSGGKDWFMEVNNSGVLTTTNEEAVDPLDDVLVGETREKYRNRQTVRHGSDLALSVTENDVAEQNARKAIEGGTGIYHAVEDAKDISSASEATALAQALLRRFTLPKTIRLSLLKRGLRAGQTVGITIPKQDVRGDFFIDKLSLRDEGRETLIYSITALSGEHQGDVMDSWRAAFGSAED